jgi:hypothetical protein
MLDIVAKHFTVPFDFHDERVDTSQRGAYKSNAFHWDALTLGDIRGALL